MEAVKAGIEDSSAVLEQDGKVARAGWLRDAYRPVAGFASVVVLSISAGMVASSIFVPRLTFNQLPPQRRASYYKTTNGDLFGKGMLVSLAGAGLAIIAFKKRDDEDNPENESVNALPAGSEPGI